MNDTEAIYDRHSVRQYKNKPLPADVIGALQEEIDCCNKEGGLHIQLVTNEPKAFGGFMAHYGKFEGVTNYFALIGKKSDDLEERCGYYGERLVLLSQKLGLNTCWVALTYKKVPSAFRVLPGEKLALVISVGYGKTEGVSHRSKNFSDVSHYDGEMPQWFRDGVSSALLAPTAINQQSFFLFGTGNTVSLKAGKGPCVKVDRGIVKLHFELGAKTENFLWE